MDSDQGLQSWQVVLGFSISATHSRLDVHGMLACELSCFWIGLLIVMGGFNYTSSAAAATVLQLWSLVPVLCSPCWTTHCELSLRPFSQRCKKWKQPVLSERARGQLMRSSWCSRVDAVLASGQGPSSVQMRMMTSVAGPAVAGEGHP